MKKNKEGVIVFYATFNNIAVISWRSTKEANLIETNRYYKLYMFSSVDMEILTP